MRGDGADDLRAPGIGEQALGELTAHVALADDKDALGKGAEQAIEERGGAQLPEREQAKAEAEGIGDQAARKVGHLEEEEQGEKGEQPQKIAHQQEPPGAPVGQGAGVVGAGDEEGDEPGEEGRQIDARRQPAARGLVDGHAEGDMGAQKFAAFEREQDQQKVEHQKDGPKFFQDGEHREGRAG